VREGEGGRIYKLQDYSELFSINFKEKIKRMIGRYSLQKE